MMVSTGPALAVTSSTGVMSLAVGLLGSEAGGANGTRGDVAGFDGVRAIHTVEVPTERRHAEELGPRLTELLERAGLAPRDLALLAVDVGPGRFTGLRVGLATVRGLAFALQIPVVGCTSLEILAAGVVPPNRPPGDEGGTVTAVIDARRQEVFQQVFVDGRPAGPARVGRPEELVTEARGVVLGDGLDRYRDLYLDRDLHLDRDGASVGASAGLVALEGRHPRAADLLALAAGRTARPGFDVHPVYLREPDAKANIRTRPEAPAR